MGGSTKFVGNELLFGATKGNVETLQICLMPDNIMYRWIERYAARYFPIASAAKTGAEDASLKCDLLVRLAR